MSVPSERGMMCGDELLLRLDRLQTRALVVGIGGLALSLGAWVLSPRSFYPAYLVGYMFWLGVALGSIGLVMLHHLVGGSWGLVIRRPLEAGVQTIPVLALLFVPIGFGISTLYPWARPGDSEAINASVRSLYLNESLFLVRAAGYFGVWTAMAFLLAGWSIRQDHTKEYGPSRRLQRLAGPGTVILFAASTFSAVDWVMSLEAPWVSSIFGAMVITGEAMATFAVMIVVAGVLAESRPMSQVATPDRLNDLGNLLLAFVMLWAYMSFCQFLIIWSGNLSEEIPWYLKRTRGGWEWVALGLVVCQFFLPFFMLLVRENKRRSRSLFGVCLLILFMHWIDLVWLVIPASTDVASPRISWTEIGLSALSLAGVGGIWIAALVSRLKRQPLVPLNDPSLVELLERVGA